MYRILILAILLAALPTSVAVAEPMPEFEAEYRAYYGSMRGASTRFSLERGEDGDWFWRSFSEPAGMVSMVRNDEIRERSRFRFEDDELLPLSYHYRHEEGGDLRRARQVRFDWDEGKAHYDDDGDTGEIAVEAGTLERFLAQLALMHDMKRDQRRDDYLVFHRDEVIRQAVDYAGEERKRVRAGRFDTHQIHLKDADSDRKLTLWLAPELDYLPVQLLQSEPGERDIRMELEDWDGL